MRLTVLQWNIDYREPIEAIAKQILQWRPDYILYRGNLHRRQTKTVDTPLSDHLPLLTTFELAR